MKRVLFRIVLPIVILLAGVVAAWQLYFAGPASRIGTPEGMSKSPSRTKAPQRDDRLLTVEVVRAEPQTWNAVVETTGTVQPSREVTIIPEIAGRIIERNEALVPGGRLDEGETLVRIDSRRYRLAVAQQAGKVQAAELELSMEQGRGKVAKREWNLIGKDSSRGDSRLALRRPHLKASESNLSAARAGLEQARLDLSLTVLRAPWNATVIDAQADVGQVVGPSSRLATLVGTDRFWVEASLPASQLPLLEIPTKHSPVASVAEVIHELGDGEHVERRGELLRLVSQLDSETRRARVIIAVDNPLDEPAGAVPLLPNTHVTVRIEGRQFSKVLRLPRSAIHEGTRIWIVGEEDRLAVRDIGIAWGTDEYVYIRDVDWLTPGTRVVTSPLRNPVKGTKVGIVQRTRPELESSP